MATAIGLMSEEELVEASPWFHSDHLVNATGNSGGSSSGSGVCDWCEQKTSGGGGGGANSSSYGCDACGCACYCSKACATAAAPHHARNCARLRRLSAAGAVLEAVGGVPAPGVPFQPGWVGAAPMFIYGD
jgi:hypothetical protein